MIPYKPISLLPEGNYFVTVTYNSATGKSTVTCVDNDTDEVVYSTLVPELKTSKPKEKGDNVNDLRKFLGKKNRKCKW